MFYNLTIMKKEDIHENPLGNRPSWDEFFMALAITYSSRSSCIKVKAGSIITYNNEIMGTGYNGAPSKLRSCLETGCRKELKGLRYEDSLGSSTCVGVHAEMNAAGHLKKSGLKDLTLYTTIFPCHSCAKDLLSYGLSRLIFKSFYSEKETETTYEILEEAGVEIQRLNLSPERYLDIVFGKPASNFDVWDSEERKKIELIKRLKT
jgi:dCMP deaminase